MSRSLTLTPAQWAAVQAGGWLVMPGGPDAQCRQCRASYSLPFELQCANHQPVPLPPAALVAAAAKCETCDGRRGWPSDYWPDEIWDCPDCQIELLGKCSTCKGTASIEGRNIASYDACWEDNCDGTVTLGHAYAVSEVLPILAPGQDPSPGVDKWVSHICDYPDRGLCLWEYNGGTGRGPGWKVSGGLSLASYGDPTTLVGQYALRLEVQP